MSDVLDDLDAYVTKHDDSNPMRRWFADRPDVWMAIVTRVVEGTVPAEQARLWLADRHEFPFASSSFRHMVRDEKQRRRQERRDQRQEALA